MKIFFLLFVFIVTDALAESFEPPTGDFQSRIGNHPTVLTIRLRKAIANLVNYPDSIFNIGIKPVSGDKHQYDKLLGFMLRRSKVTDLSFIGYNPLHIAAGKVDALSITISNIFVPPLLFDSLTITLTGVVFDLKALEDDGLFVMTELKGFSFETVVLENVLRKLLGSGFYLQISEGHIQILTTVKLFLFQLNARIRGTLFIRDNESICFSTDSLNVGDLPFAALFKNRVSSKLNPMFSLSECLGNAGKVVDTTLTEVSLKDKRVIICGKGTIALCK